LRITEKAKKKKNGYERLESGNERQRTVQERLSDGYLTAIERVKNGYERVKNGYESKGAKE